MSIFTTIKDAAVNSFEHVKKVITGIFVNDVEPAITTFFHVIETNGGAALITVAIDVVKAAGSGTKFGELIELLTASAKTAGITVGASAAKAALTVAQTHLEQELSSKA